MTCNVTGSSRVHLYDRSGLSRLFLLHMYTVANYKFIFVTQVNVQALVVLLRN